MPDRLGPKFETNSNLRNLIKEKQPFTTSSCLSHSGLGIFEVVSDFEILASIFFGRRGSALQSFLDPAEETNFENEKTRDRVIT
jgi:hypothetical protein